MIDQFSTKNIGAYMYVEMPPYQFLVETAQKESLHPRSLFVSFLG